MIFFVSCSSHNFILGLLNCWNREYSLWCLQQKMLTHLLWAVLWVYGDSLAVMEYNSTSLDCISSVVWWHVLRKQWLGSPTKHDVRSQRSIVTCMYVSYCQTVFVSRFLTAYVKLHCTHNLDIYFNAYFSHGYD